MGMKCVFSKSGESLTTLKLETGSPEFSLRLFLTTRIFHTKLLQFKFVAQLDIIYFIIQLIQLRGIGDTISMTMYGWTDFHSGIGVATALGIVQWPALFFTKS